MSEFSIQTPKGRRTIGPGHPCFIISELSGNHHQDLNEAKKLIDEAVRANVDAVKLQTYTADTLTIDSNKDYFQIKVNEAWAGKTLYQLYQEAYTPWEWQPELKEYAESKGLVLFSTPFDPTAVDFLEELNMELYKVASFETGDIPLLKRIGKTKKPVILSRGLTTIEELELAIRTLKENGCPEVVVLHCVSAYPATPDQMNLKTIPDIAKRFQVIAGLSDHSLGTTVAVTAVALGANVIEKHFIMDRKAGGPDATFSLEPAELRQLVESVRIAEQALGEAKYEGGKREKENLAFKKSIFVVKDIKKGESLTTENLRVIRPGYGIKPKFFEQVLGKTASKDLVRGEPLSEVDIKEGLAAI